VRYRFIIDMSSDFRGAIRRALMDTTAFLAMAKDLTTIDGATLTLDSELRDVGWDSLSNVEFIALVDAECGVVVDAGRLADCVTLGDVHALTVPVSA
jgi:acyl carrier protein